MQEAGISKRVAIRIEDWAEKNGEVPAEAAPATSNGQEQSFAGR